MGLTNLQKEEDHLGPLPENPFKLYRQAAQLSHQQVANLARMAKYSVIKAEQGTPANPYPKLVEFWLRHPKGPSSELEVVKAYEQFQFDMRQRHINYFGPELFISSSLSLHPFRQLRRSRYLTYSQSYSPSPVGLKQVARDLCLPSDTLEFFEKKWRKQKSTPRSLMMVLDFIGYEAEYFDKVYKTWRETHNQVNWGGELDG